MEEKKKRWRQQHWWGCDISGDQLNKGIEGGDDKVTCGDCDSGKQTWEKGTAKWGHRVNG